MSKKVQLITGARFGKLSVIREVLGGSSRPKVHYLCDCDCGNIVTIESYKLRNLRRCCGCTIPPSRLTHGKSGTPEFGIWAKMWQRCKNPESPDYPLYKNRTPPDEWRSFEVFMADMGPRPSNRHTLDRKNNSLPYSAENCRWATWTVQQRNRSNNRMVCVGDKQVSLAEACEIANITFSIVRTRLYTHKWPIERALGPQFSWPNNEIPDVLLK